MNKTNNLRAYLRDLYEGIVSKKPDASRNPQNFRSEIEAIRTGGEFYEVMDASELPLDAPDGSLALVEGEPIPQSYIVSSVDELPSDAVDGSLAIVQKTAQATKYVLNSEINAPSQILSIGFYSASRDNDQIATPYDTMNVGVLGPPVDCLYYGPTNVYYFDNSIGFQVGWIKEAYRTIAVVAILDEAAATWLDENGTNTGEIVNVPTSQQLYARINGEWVYKCRNNRGAQYGGKR